MAQYLVPCYVLYMSISNIVSFLEIMNAPNSTE
jgi:hypothetical protein